jgi:hypothetical protein
MSRRARLWTIIALAAAVILAGVFTLYRAQVVVTSKDISFAFPEKGTAVVDFSVTKHPSNTAQCAIQILSEDHAVVGWTTVTIDPVEPGDPDASADGSTTVHRVTMRNVSPGVNGGVHSCWTVR